MEEAEGVDTGRGNSKCKELEVQNCKALTMLEESSRRGLQGLDLVVQRRSGLP